MSGFGDLEVNLTQLAVRAERRYHRTADRRSDVQHAYAQGARLARDEVATTAAGATDALVVDSAWRDEGEEVDSEGAAVTLDQTDMARSGVTSKDAAKGVPSLPSEVEASGGGAASRFLDGRPLGQTVRRNSTAETHNASLVASDRLLYGGGMQVVQGTDLLWGCVLVATVAGVALSRRARAARRGASDVRPALFDVEAVAEESPLWSQCSASMTSAAERGMVWGWALVTWRSIHSAARLWLEQKQRQQAANAAVASMLKSMHTSTRDERPKAIFSDAALTGLGQDAWHSATDKVDADRGASVATWRLEISTKVSALLLNDAVSPRGGGGLGAFGVSAPSATLTRAAGARHNTRQCEQPIDIPGNGNLSPTGVLSYEAGSTDSYTTSSPVGSLDSSLESLSSGSSSCSFDDTDASILPINPSTIVSKKDWAFLHALLPPFWRMHTMQCAYSSRRDGLSLRTLYRSCSGRAPTLLLVHDSGGGVFGCYATAPWRVTYPHSVGSGECFVFRLKDKSTASYHRGKTPGRLRREAFHYQPGASAIFQTGAAHSMCVGGGDGFAIWLSDDLQKGTSHPCGTFGSPCLASTNEFEVLAIEVLHIEY